MVDMPSQDIAKKLGVQLNTLRQWIRRYKWVDARTAQRTRGAEIVAKHVLGVATDAVIQHQARVSKAVDKHIDCIAESFTSEPEQLVKLGQALKHFDDVGRRNLGLSTEGEGKSPVAFNLNIGSMEVRKKSTEIDSTSPVVDVDSMQVVEDQQKIV